MSDPSPEPGCDLACQTKIILNGGNIAGIADANWKALENMNRAGALNKVNGKALIQLLNRMEDDAVEVQKLIARGAGYTGPTGKMLND